MAVKAIRYKKLKTASTRTMPITIFERLAVKCRYSERALFGRMRNFNRRNKYDEDRDYLWFFRSW